MGGKKKNLSVEGKALREQFTEEIKLSKPSGPRKWYKLLREQNRRLGQFYCKDVLMQELADLLKQYDDLLVHYYSGDSLNVYGHGPREGVRSGKVRGRFRLWINDYSGALWLGFYDGSIRECNALDWLENLENVAGKNLALLIQDDATLYEFYQKYTDWFAPYGKRLTSWKSEFITILLSWMKSLILSLQDEEICSKNIRFNLLGILHRLADELKEYKLSSDSEKIVWIPYGVRIREGKETWVLEVDTENFNCIKVRIRNDDSGKQGVARTLTDRQVLQMLLQLMEMLEYSNNPYCILFRFAMCRYIQEYIPLAEEELDEKEVINILKSLIE